MDVLNILQLKASVAAMSLSFVGAHPAGFCDVAFIDNIIGVQLVTCGQDGKLCYRQASKPSEVIKSIDAHASGEGPSPLTCVVASPSGERVSIADEQNFVKVFVYPSGDLLTTATRFSLPARCLAYSPSGLHMAAAGDDELIKLIDLSGNKVFRTLKTDGYIRGMAYDPESEYLAAVDAFGTLNVWNVGSGKSEFVKKKTCPRVDLTAPVRVRPAWHPDGGATLAVPAADGAIALFERLSWESVEELTQEGHSSPAHLLAFCKNGLYLAASYADQNLIIWDVNEKKAIAKKTITGVACGLAWHPTANALAVATEDGDVGVWDSPVPASMQNPTMDIDVATGVTKTDAEGVRRFIDGAAMSGSEAGGDGSDDEYDREESFLAGSPGGGGGGGGGHKSGRNAYRRSRAHTGHTRGGLRPAAPSFTLADLPQPQPAIQPGSTSLDAGRRYLAYTNLGAITLRSEGDHNVVEVAFHDTARVRRRVPLLTDFFGFTMGSLGETGALYASQSSADAPSTLLYRPFDPWAPNSEWSMGLPAGEEAECIAAGRSFVAAATSARMLRLLTPAGLQSAVLSLPGAPVALAARGGRLAAAWHAAPPTPAGDQCIEVGEYAVDEQRQLRVTRLALSPGASLSWLGHTEEGALASYDSEGVLRVLSPDFGGAWVPVFAAATERRGGEHFWAFAASLARAEVQCIVCANSPEPLVPSGSVRPVVTAAPLRVPVAPHDDALAPLEADIMRQGLVMALGREAETNTDSDAQLEAALQAAQVEGDRSALRLFTRLCQTDRQARALEVAAGLQTSAGLAGAAKIAHHHRMSTLAEAVAGISQQRADAEAMEEEIAEQGRGEGSYAHHQHAMHAAAAAATPQAPVFNLRVAGSGGPAREQQQQQPATEDGPSGRNVLEENGSPNGKAGGKEKEKEAGTKRKASTAGNPFARKKGHAAKTNAGNA